MLMTKAKLFCDGAYSRELVYASHESTRYEGPGRGGAERAADVSDSGARLLLWEDLAVTGGRISF